MSEQSIVDLLYWTKGEDYLPKRYRMSDRFLNPITKRISTYAQLKAHQVYYSLWLPTVRGLKDKFPGLEVELYDGMYIVSHNGRVGAGVGENEAMLSFLHNVRQDEIAQC